MPLIPLNEKICNINHIQFSLESNTEYLEKNQLWVEPYFPDMYYYKYVSPENE